MDEPTILDAKEAALVTANGATELTLLMPAFADGEIVPELMLFLAACHLRSEDDPEWYAEQIDWMAKELEDGGVRAVHVQ